MVKNILITGSNGFLGKNLISKINEVGGLRIIKFTKENDYEQLKDFINKSDLIFHLAGENRSLNEQNFIENNVTLTKVITETIKKKNRKNQSQTRIIFASSIHATSDEIYGRTKRAAEKLIENLENEFNQSCAIFRLPGIFGKWCKPNYNSVVATFCYNILNDKKLEIHDGKKILRLAYVDDVINQLIEKMYNQIWSNLYINVSTIYNISVAELADKIDSYHNQRRSLYVSNVGTGIDRALYATYLSYLNNASDFKYPIKSHTDTRGSFVEMIKTRDCGQVSFFTAKPGITRGGHYHHTKSEKFLVISGQACFRFENIDTGEKVRLHTDGIRPEIVETVPGWAHDITNVGTSDLIVLLWANEIFDNEKPDTFSYLIER